MKIGVIGLGRRWQKHFKPALRALRERFSVHLVCDQVEQRAHREARMLGCGATVGPSELLASDDVEAVLLPDAQWFGLWPVEQACRLGKPVLCGDELLPGEVRLEEVQRQVRDRGLAVMLEMAPRQAPATAVLRDLLANRLGPARGVVCHFAQPRRPGSVAVPLTLLDWCAVVLDAAPVSVLSSRSGDDRFTTALLEFPDSRWAQLTGWEAEAGHVPHCRVVAERGLVTLRLPNHVEWSDAEGNHRFTANGRSAVRASMVQFLEAVRTGRAPQPNLGDACRALRWSRAAERSRTEGRRIDLAG